MAKEAIAYPELPKTPADDPTVTHAMFWRAAWLRDLAEHTALERLVAKLHGLKGTDYVTLRALYSALQHSEKEVKDSFRELVQYGGLLYAWVPDAKKGGAA
jgi:hypothetical protein